MVKIKKRPFSVAVGILVILTVILLIVSNFEKGNEGYVLHIDDQGVTEEEFQMLAKEHCNEVYMLYTTEQVNQDNFWTKRKNGTVPYKVLQENILSELTRNYALKSLALELEIIEDYSYEQLMEEKNQVNDSAEYGVNNHSEATYYKYWYSNLETQVRNSLISEKTDISEADCKEYYNENQEYYTCDIAVDIWYGVIPKSDEASHKAYQLSKAMESFDTIEELSEEEYFSDVEFQELSLSSIDTQEGMSGVFTKRWEIASGLSEGEVSIPYEENNAYCVVKCIAREENKPVDFESVSGQIERYLQIEEAKKIIEDKIEQQKVKLEKNKLKDIITQL